MGKIYSSLLFDLDDTLIDNNESVKYGIEGVFEELNKNFSDANFQDWKRFDDSYWAEIEAGRVILPERIKSREQRVQYLRATRFVDYFGISYEDAVKINDDYVRGLAKKIVAIDDSPSLLEELHKIYEIVIITNGPLKAAHKKIDAIKIGDYVDHIAIGEVCGFPKPTKEFFDYTIAMMDNKDKEQMLVIGDSLNTDILGGNNNGIDTCWYNYRNDDNYLNANPTYEIKKLKELKKILRRN